MILEQFEESEWKRNEMLKWVKRELFINLYNSDTISIAFCNVAVLTFLYHSSEIIGIFIEILSLLDCNTQKFKD